MTGRDLTPSTESQTSSNHQYQDVSVIALGIMLLVLLHRGMGRWSFFPVLIGLLGMVLRWQITPLVTLILLTGLLFAGDVSDQPLFWQYASRRFSLPDWFLCGAVLAFCAAQYRMQGMMRSILPAEQQRRRHRLLGQPMLAHQRRSPRLVSSSEIGWLVLLLPICAFLAQLCWRQLPAGGMAYGLSSWSWHGIVLAWLLILGVLAASGLFSYVGQRRLRDTEARLYLQDIFWQENGSEQRRLNRWLVWAKLRRRRKDKR